MRPHIHFTAPTGWLNDPNGLVYHNDRYHLFYQHHPASTEWGPMHWGHAISDDLLNWEHLPIALYPDKTGTMYSGSAIVDHKNEAGFGAGALLLFYTAAGHRLEPKARTTQALAVSQDGLSFEKYPGNPIVPELRSGNRDPKVVWHQASRRWMMALYIGQLNDEHMFQILHSTNLTNWRCGPEIPIPGKGECPDLFPLNCEGEEHWVFWTATGLYAIGSCDGERFSPITGWIDGYTQTWPLDQQQVSPYAAQTWSDLPDGRRIQVPWLRGQFPGADFNQQMGIPVELELRRTAAGLRLHSRPVRELAQLHGQGQSESLIDLRRDAWQCRGEEALHISGMIDRAAGEILTIRSGTCTIEINDRGINAGSGPVPLPNTRRMSCEIVIDTASCELFLADGLVSLPLFRAQSDIIDCSIQGNARLSNWQWHKCLSQLLASP